MAKTAHITIRIEPEVKKQAEKLFSMFGMNVSDAINIFLHKSILVGGLPFEFGAEIQNAETVEAMQEMDNMMSGKIPMGKLYSNTDELFKGLKS